VRQARIINDVPAPYSEAVDKDRLVRDPLVSVVMLAYNHEPYIAQAIEGVVSQETDFPIELIIGEDCSTDRTREIVLDYQRRYPESIRVLYAEKNVGGHANSVRSVLASRGKYIAFCEGDDWWHRRDKLKFQVPFLQADDSLVCLSGEVQHISPKGEVVKPAENSDAAAPQPIRIGYEDLIFQTVPFPTCTVVARADAVRQAMVGDTLYADHSQLLGDTPLWIELCQRGKIIHRWETMASYRLSLNSAMRQTDPLHAWRFEMSYMDVRYLALERYPLPGEVRRTSSAKSYFIHRILLRAAWTGNGNMAMKQLRRLRRLGEKVGWKEMRCVIVALIPLPRRWLKALYLTTAPYLERMGLNFIKASVGEAVFPSYGKE
jgi:glycosyltransferase involved in cell wall biosynthesis